jgi:hypothetical protein
MRVLFSEGVAGGLTDTELLERFTTRNGEAAELSECTFLPGACLPKDLFQLFYDTG